MPGALARADGPVCGGMLLVIGCAAGAKQRQTRFTADDTVLVLAARDQLDGARLGDLGEPW